jgi:hypothetical protein
LVGPFQKAKGGFTRIFVAVDKFTKWIKIRPAASITVAKVVEFIKKSCTCLAFPITLSTIMGLRSLRGNLRTFVQNWALKLIMPQCQTHRTTVKWSTQTA